jgi:NADPH:quinone reductase-like Zn-dependent oxidoreductase
MVLNSQDAKTLEKSLNVLKAGGQLVSISGPPTPEFADDLKLSWFVKQVTRALSLSTRKKAKQHKVDFSFLFMTASGSQLRQITPLIESGIIRPVIDKVFPFDATNEAMTYVESGRAKGKVVIKLR